MEQARTVLYVDDEDMARKYFGRAFGNEYRVLTAPGVDAALALLDGHDVDVLVTDYRMPGKPGSVLLREVERTRPGLVRILVTAYADKEVLLETVNGGDLFRVLEKPVRQDALREVLRQAADEAVRRARDRAARDHGLLAVEETVAFLSHELGAPLATMAGFARALARRVHEARTGEGGAMAPEASLLGARIGNAVAHIDDNARYCQAVLASLVDAVSRAALAPAARVAAGSAHGMVTALLEATPMGAAERAAITVDVRHDFGIRAAPNCVALVLSALLDNGLRALRGGPEPRLRVTIGADGRHVITVEHNGACVAPDVLHRLQLDPVPMHDGDGWGLIFCNRVMQSFGGHLRVRPGAAVAHGEQEDPQLGQQLRQQEGKQERQQEGEQQRRQESEQQRRHQEQQQDKNISRGMTITMHFPAPPKEQA